MTVCDETTSPSPGNRPAHHLPSFEAYCEKYPNEAEQMMTQLAEITQVSDRQILNKAFNSSRKSKEEEFNVGAALEFLLEPNAMIKRSSSASSPSSHHQSPPQQQQPSESPNKIQTRSKDNRIISSEGAAPKVKAVHGPLPKTPSNSPEAPLEASSSMDVSDSSKETNKNRNAPSLLDVSSNTQDEDLQKAIKLSLEEANKSTVSSGVSQEEQDVSKALEASLMDGGSNRRKRKDKWEDPLNPHDRKRNGVWPVGLKNVGQTCWFSAVIQSLFYLPAFRSLVLNFSVPARGGAALKNDKKTKKILEFMEELRKLFALLVASRRKYVDPVRSVEILKGSIGSSSMDNNQQDVSEFTHKVLEWAELAFKLTSERQVQVEDEATLGEEEEEESSMETDTKTSSGGRNPMANLFYGEVMTEGKNRGVAFSHTDTIGQWNLHVHQFNDIHESLENSTALEYFDNDSLNGQERWFSKLQPVLFFELSRFQFNQERKLAEKIHNKLEFPQTIFMDRYMDSNKNVTRHKREQTRILKEKRDGLLARLQKFTHYGSGEKKIPLGAVLAYAMDFANSGNSPKNAMMTPSGSLANVAEDEGESSMMMEVEPASSGTAPALGLEDSDSNKNNCDKNNTTDFCPTPKFVSDAEQQTIQNCFLRWKAEVEAEVSSLENSRKELDTQIQEMYSEESLQKMEYRLHAVMVHEGYVDSGHYWAYVYDHKRKSWLKFNDNSVNETSWEELFKESVGGHSNTSAYSLVYVDTSRPELFDSDEQKMEEESSGGDFDSLLETLPNDLREFVQKDNSELEREMAEWDAARRMEEETSKKEGASDVMVIGERLNHASTHAGLVVGLSARLLKSSSSFPESSDPFQALIEHTFTHYKELTAQEQHNSCGEELRLESFLLYCLLNDVPQRCVELALIEQFAFLPLSACESTFGEELKTYAANALAAMEKGFPREAGRLKDWHRAYHLFRLSVYWFVLGLEDLVANRFDESLEYFSIASYITQDLNKSPPAGPKKGLDMEALMQYLRQSLSEVNHSLIKMFKLGEHLSSVFSNLERIVPVMNFLQMRINSTPRPLEEDSNCLEEVRSQWCSLLGENYMPDKCSSILSDAIRIVLEPPPDLCPEVPKVLENLPETIHEKDNCELSERYRKIIKLSSDLKTAAAAN